MQKQDKKKNSILYHEDHKRSQGYVDVKKLNENELKEIIERQEKLLKNKSFILKLPDKGSKIIAFKTEVENELKRRRKQIDTACELLANLTINHSSADDIEWNNGKVDDSKKQFDNDVNDDDDDDSDENVDPLKLIATHSGTTQCSARKKVINPEPSLITENDLRDIKEMKYDMTLCEKFGKAIPAKERFKPNQLKNNSNDKFVISAENIRKKRGDKWEVTEATPPVPIFNNTKMVSLSESLQLQRKQAEHLKEIERQYAAERLLKSINVQMGDILPTKDVAEYRTPKDIFEETAEQSDEETPMEKLAIDLDEDH